MNTFWEALYAVLEVSVFQEPAIKVPKFEHSFQVSLSFMCLTFGESILT